MQEREEEIRHENTRLAAEVTRLRSIAQNPPIAVPEQPVTVPDVVAEESWQNVLVLLEAAEQRLPMEASDDGERLYAMLQDALTAVRLRMAPVAAAPTARRATARTG